MRVIAGTPVIVSTVENCVFFKQAVPGKFFLDVCLCDFCVFFFIWVFGDQKHLPGKHSGSPTVVLNVLYK